LPVGALEKRPRLREALDRAVERARGTEHFPRLVSRFSLARYDSEMIQLALAKPDETTGIESIRALLDAGRTGTIEKFIGSEDPRVGVSTVEVLGNSLHRRATALVVAALKDSRLDDEVRAQAVRSLGKSGSGIEAMIELAENGNFPEELLPAAGRAVTGTMNVALRGRAAELFPVPPLKNDEPLPQMTELLVYIGDPENGKKIYTTATCITCHQVGGAGTSFGPDLSGIGNRFNP